MTSHELANLLLSFPDMAVATHAHGHTYHSVRDRTSHGALKIAVVETGWKDDHALAIGDIIGKEPRIVKVLHGWPATPYTGTPWGEKEAT